MTSAAIARHTLSLESAIPRTVSVVQPNGSRLSCGRRAGERKGPARREGPARARKRSIPIRAGPSASSAR
jgi:hypothetical protein